MLLDKRQKVWGRKVPMGNGQGAWKSFVSKDGKRPMGLPSLLQVCHRPIGFPSMLRMMLDHLAHSTPLKTEPACSVSP